MSAFRFEIIGDCILYRADCLELTAALAPIEAVVSDPPYGIGHKHSGCGGGLTGKGGRRSTESVIGDDGPFDPAPWLDFQHVILWGANHYAARLPHGRWLAWDKLAGVDAFDNFSDVEFAWRKGRGKDVIFSHLWKGLLQGSEKGGRQRFHPTQKPVALMRWCIERLPDDVTVLDPYMGSGTTGVACVQLGRRFVGVEIDPGHFETACRRIEEAYRQPSLFHPVAEAPPPPTLFDDVEAA